METVLLTGDTLSGANLHIFAKNEQFAPY